MKLEETYAYLKDHYGITHSFSTFKKNAIRKGLEKDKDYLMLIVSVLFSMGQYHNGVIEVATDIHETYAGELDGVEAHMKSLEAKLAEAEQLVKTSIKEAEEAQKDVRAFHLVLQSKNKLIRELRAKKDVTRNKMIEREVRKLEKESSEYYDDCAKLTKENKKLKEEIKQIEEVSDANYERYDKERKYSSSADAKIETLGNIVKKYREEVAFFKNAENERHVDMLKWKRTAIERRKVIDSKRIEVSRLYREGEKLKEKNAFYKSSVAQWKEENKKLKGEIQLLKCFNLQWNEENQELQDELNTLKHQTLFQTLQTYFKNKKS